jgi:hypothetical protein
VRGPAVATKGLQNRENIFNPRLSVALRSLRMLVKGRQPVLSIEHWDNGRTCGLRHATTCAFAFLLKVEGRCVPFLDFLTLVLSSRLYCRSSPLGQDISFLPIWRIRGAKRIVPSEPERAVCFSKTRPANLIRPSASKPLNLWMRDQHWSSQPSIIAQNGNDESAFVAARRGAS